jgi:hypothetical protein
MTNYIGEGLDFLDKRQQQSIYDIMNHEAEALEYILDDPSSILNEITLLIGEDLALDRGKGLTDEIMEKALGFGHLYQETKRKRVLKNINNFDPDAKLIKRAMDEWQLDFHRDYDGLMDELDEFMVKFRKYCEKRDKLEIFKHARRVIRNHLRFGWTYDIFEDSEPLKVSKVQKIQSLHRGNKSRLSSKAVGIITDKQKRTDWPKLRKSMLDEGFTEEETQDFYDNTYMASRIKTKKRSRKKTKKKKRKSKKKYKN